MLAKSCPLGFSACVGLKTRGQLLGKGCPLAFLLVLCYRLVVSC